MRKLEIVLRLVQGNFIDISDALILLEGDFKKSEPYKESPWVSNEEDNNSIKVDKTAPFVNLPYIIPKYANPGDTPESWGTTITCTGDTPVFRSGFSQPVDTVPQKTPLSILEEEVSKFTKKFNPESEDSDYVKNRIDNVIENIDWNKAYNIFDILGLTSDKDVPDATEEHKAGFIEALKLEATSALKLAYKGFVDDIKQNPGLIKNRDYMHTTYSDTTAPYFRATVKWMGEGESLDFIMDLELVVCEALTDGNLEGY